MKIPFVNIVQILKECNTGSVPFLCTCINANGELEKYYYKYILNEKEYCGLVYEIIGNQLAAKLGINVPEIAFGITGKIVEHNEKIPQNYLVAVDSICFASKEIEPHTMISEENVISDKPTFNRFHDAEKLLRIALLDLWIYNTDRSSINPNLMAEISNDGFYLYAIDHFHCFGGDEYFEKDFSTLSVNPYKNILSSSFGNSMLGYLEVTQNYSIIANEFVQLTNGNKIKQIIENVFQQLPPDWKVNQQLSNQLINFLTDSVRNKQVLQTFKELINS